MGGLARGLGLAAPASYCWPESRRTWARGHGEVIGGHRSVARGRAPRTELLGRREEVCGHGYDGVCGAGAAVEVGSGVACMRRSKSGCVELLDASGEPKTWRGLRQHTGSTTSVSMAAEFVGLGGGRRIRVLEEPGIGGFCSPER